MQGTGRFDRKLIRLPLDYVGTPEVAEIRVTVPSILQPGASGSDLAIGLELRDCWGLHLPGARAELSLELEGGAGEVPKSVEVLPDHDSHLVVRGRLTERNRVYRLRVRDRFRGIEAVSNPCWVPERLSFVDHRLYWGDLHAHRLEDPKRKTADPRLWCQGPATVDEFYRYARDVVHLDFAALTDHDYALTTDEWRQIQEGAQYYNQPGRFVSILGYEWAWNGGPDGDHGHRNVLTVRDDLPLLCSSWLGSSTPPDLFNLLRKISRNGIDVMSIPHHPARLAGRVWHNWETMDPYFERLMEIYSNWGSSEHAGEPHAITNALSPAQWAATSAAYPPFEATGHFLQDGLRRGLRFGFTGGSESHDGRAGDTVIHNNQPAKPVSFLHPAGLTGIWARRQTREAIWSSLWQRRTIASTGARILVDLAVDEQPMGETIVTSAPPRRMQVRVHGAGALARVAVVRNNCEWHVVEQPGWDCVFTLENLALPHGEADWYYVRVTQADGHMAWSSPIWVERAA